MADSVGFAVMPSSRVFATHLKEQDSPWGKVSLVQSSPEAVMELKIGEKIVTTGRNDENAMEFLVTPHGVLLLTASSALSNLNSGRTWPGIKNRLYFYDAQAGKVNTVVDDGHYHELHSASPSGDAVIISIQPMEREFLLHSRLPKKDEHLLVCVDLKTHSTEKIAALRGWETPVVKWGPQGDKVAIFGSVGESIAPVLSSWDRGKQELVLLVRETDVWDFLPLPDGRVAFSGNPVLDGTHVPGVFIARGIGKEPEVIEANIAVPEPLGFDPATGKVLYESLSLRRTSTGFDIDAGPKPAAPSQVALEEHSDEQGKSLWLAGRKIAVLNQNEKVSDTTETSEGVVYGLRSEVEGGNVVERLILVPKEGEARSVGPRGRFFEVLSSDPRSSEIVLLSRPSDYGERRSKADPALWDQRLVLLDAKTGVMTEIAAPVTWGGPIKAKWSPAKDVLYVKSDMLYRWSRQTGKLEQALSKHVSFLDILPISGNRVVFSGSYLSDTAPGSKVERALFLGKSDGEIVQLDPGPSIPHIYGFDEATQTLRYQNPLDSASTKTVSIRE